MTNIKSLISKYNITLMPDNEHIQVRGRLTPAQQQEIIAGKPAIIMYLMEQRKAEEERKAKIAAIEGLKELRDAIIQDEINYEKYQAQFESESGVIHGREKIDIKGLKDKYPRASAYLMAESYANSENYSKAAIGAKAKERIINGEDWNKVIDEMKKEWSDEADRHMWD